MPNEKADKFFSRICAARLAKDTHGAKIKICGRQEEANRSGNIEHTMVCGGDIGKEKQRRWAVYEKLINYKTQYGNVHNECPAAA